MIQLVAISALSAQTGYDFYVSKICSSTDTSATIGPISVTTQCAPVSAPLEENFDTWAGILHVGQESRRPPQASVGLGMEAVQVLVELVHYQVTRGHTTYILRLLLERETSLLRDFAWYRSSVSAAPSLSFAYHMVGAADGYING